MSQKLIKVEAAQSKLRQAFRENRPVYISGTVGMGKKTAVKAYLGRKKYTFISLADESAPALEKPESIEDSIVVISGVSKLHSAASEEAILQLAEDTERNLILIGEGPLPEWMAEISVRRDFMLIGDRDLQLSDEEIRELFAAHGKKFRIDGPIFQDVLRVSRRNTMLLFSMAEDADPNELYTDTDCINAKRKVYRYLENVHLNRLSHTMQSVLLSLCLFDEIPLGLAELILARPRVGQELEYMIRYGGMFEEIRENVYRIPPFYQDFLRWKVAKEYSTEQIHEILDRAAVYYEIHDELDKALEFYRREGKYDKIREVLLQFSESYPGMENYKMLRPYFDELAPAAIDRSPVLMSAMSMMCSLDNDIVGSER